MMPSRFVDGRATIFRALAVVPMVGAVFFGGSASLPAPRPPNTYTSFSYDSAAGDYVGLGDSEAFEQSENADVTVVGTEDRIDVTASDPNSEWTAGFFPGTGSTLHLGEYRQAEIPWLKTGRSPAMSVASRGRTCSNVWGSFTIEQVEYDRDGVLTLLELTFIQRCNGAHEPPLKGTVRLNSLPLSYRTVSQEGDPLGLGEKKTYLNSTSMISVTGGSHYLNARISGLRDTWIINMEAPVGEKFRTGLTYQLTRLGDETHAGLNITVDGRGCVNATGELTVTALVTAADETVQNLSVEFTLYCSATDPPMKGFLHVYA